MPRTITVLLLAAALVAAGCSSDDASEADPGPTNETTGEVDDMSDAADEVRRRASEALDASADTIEIDGPAPIDGSGCAFYAAWDRQSTNPFPREYAVLSDGTVVDGASEGAAGRTLDHCFFDDGSAPSAAAVAEVMVRLADAPGPIGLLDESVGQRRLEPFGVDWQPPTASGSVTDGDFTVTYFARDLETGGVFEARVTRSAEGTVDVDYRRL